MKGFTKFTLCLAILLFAITSDASATIYRYELHNSPSYDWGLGLQYRDYSFYPGLNFHWEKVSAVFDFDAPDSDMMMVVNSANNTARVFGTAAVAFSPEFSRGGHRGNPTEVLLGNALIDVRYKNLTIRGSGENISVVLPRATSANSSGHIRFQDGQLQGKRISLIGKAAGYAFRFTDLGSGLYGDGWFHTPQFSGNADFMFSATFKPRNRPPREVPEPVSSALLLSGLLGLGYQRSRITKRSR